MEHSRTTERTDVSSSFVVFGFGSPTVDGCSGCTKVDVEAAAESVDHDSSSTDDS